MKITGNDEILKYMNDTTVNRSDDNGTNGSASVQPKGRENDTIVNLSQRSKDYQVAQQAMESEPSMREEKVQDITAKVQDGSYQVNYGKTGEKMVAAFIDELV